MIFVTLGTQDKSFKRLLDEVEKQIKCKNIKDKVIVQAGYTNYKSDYMEIHKFISMDEFDKYMKECSLLITHAGVGSIMTALNYNKKVIAAARLKEYDEHTNNHQQQIAKEFSDMGYIIYLENIENLDFSLKQAKKFKPKKLKSNNEYFVKIIEDFIDNN
jgi:UDP-N-acetylglucosamine transferase subunit ALG13